MGTQDMGWVCDGVITMEGMDMKKYLSRLLHPTSTQLAIRQLKEDRKAELKFLRNCPYLTIVIGVEIRYAEKLLQLEAERLLEEGVRECV